MTRTEEYILQRLDNLERAFLQSQQNNVRVTENADKTPTIEIRCNDLSEDIETNASDIANNREGITETFESTLVNTDDISMCRDAIEEIYEMLIESEE